MNSDAQRSAFVRTYILPFLDMRRNLVFLGTFLGLFGYNLVLTVSTYDLASAGYWDILAYFAGAFILTGFVYWPLLYMGFSALDGVAWRAFIFLTQLLSMLAYIYISVGPVLLGLISGVLLAPFWCVHHIAMVQNTSKENRGYEVTLSMLITTGAAVIASALSGYYLEIQNESMANGLALAGMALGTLCLLLASKIIRQHSMRAFIGECRRIIKLNPYMARRILSQSVYDIPSLTIASLMYLMGLSPTIMATVFIARLAVMFVISPFIGTVAHTYRRHAYAIGLALIGVAWVLLACAPPNGITFFAFIMLYGIGLRFANSSLMTGLYEMQSYASMLWTETFWAIGRIGGLFALTPLMFYNTYLYLFVLVGLTGLIFVLNRKWQQTYINAQAM
ncbi:MAG: hypothetical protein AB7E52_00290 [Bdellovibrionales bacterium]